MTKYWQLSTKIVAALAVAMFPLGAFAVLLAIRSQAGLGERPPTLPQMLSMVMPVLMWLAALATAWVAVHRLVTKPLVRVQRVMEEYGRSSDTARTTVRLDNLDHLSGELAALARSFNAMADELHEHSRDLHGALVEQQRLAREVHHRVKNNLQIVSSLLSIQARGADTPEIAQIYSVIQARLTALAKVHRLIYDDSTGDRVNLHALVTDLTTNLEGSLASPQHRRITIECHAEPVLIHSDVAVPVAFLVTELAILAAAYVDDGPLDIGITAVAVATGALITVQSAGFKGLDRIAATGATPTVRIIQGMVRQLRGALKHDAAVGGYSVTFSVTPP